MSRTILPNAPTNPTDRVKSKDTDTFEYHGYAYVKDTDMILDMDTLYRIHSNEHSRYVTVRAHQHRHRPAPTPLANAQETIDFSLTLSGYSRFILNLIHSYMHKLTCKTHSPNSQKCHKLTHSLN